MDLSASPPDEQATNMPSADAPENPLRCCSILLRINRLKERITVGPSDPNE